MHWATPYIGRRFAYGGRGPDVYDCWGLVMAVYKDQFGIDLPDFDKIALQSSIARWRVIRQQMTHDYWTEIKEPEEKCVVAMGRDLISHVGVYLEADDKRVLHCCQLSVVAETFRSLRFRGYLSFRFFVPTQLRHGLHRTDPQSVQAC